MKVMNVRHGADIDKLRTRLISIPEFAELMGLKYPLALQMVLRGDVPSIKCGPRRRLDIRVIEQWLNGGSR